MSAKNEIQKRNSLRRRRRYLHRRPDARRRFAEPQMVMEALVGG